MHFYAHAGVLLQEFDPSFRRTRYRVDTGDENSTDFVWLSEAEECIDVCLDTAAPVSIRLIERNRVVGRWEQAA